MIDINTYLLTVYKQFYFILLYLRHRIQYKNYWNELTELTLLIHCIDLSVVNVFLTSKFVNEVKTVLQFYNWKMALALLYCYNCNHEFCRIWRFSPRVDRNFPIFVCEKVTALVVSVIWFVWHRNLLFCILILIIIIHTFLYRLKVVTSEAAEGQGRSC